MRSLGRLGTASVGVVLALGVAVLGQTTPQEQPKTEPAAKAAEPPKNLGTVVLQVPASATVWFGEQKMTQTGTERTYQSPPLEPGKTYSYTIKVSWPTAAGKDYTAQQDVTVRANQTSRVDFMPLAGQGTIQTLPLPALPTGRPLYPRRYEGSSYR